MYFPSFAPESETCQPATRTHALIGPVSSRLTSGSPSLAPKYFVPGSSTRSGPVSASAAITFSASENLPSRSRSHQTDAIPGLFFLGTANLMRPVSTVSSTSVSPVSTG